MKNFAHIFIIFLLMAVASDGICHAQKVRKKTSPEVGATTVWGSRPADEENALRYIVEGKDTIFIDNIRPSKVYSRLPRQKGREWRKYYRLVHNFSKAYPYALVARRPVCFQGPEGTLRCIRESDEKHDSQPGCAAYETDRQRGRKVIVQYHQRL